MKTRNRVIAIVLILSVMSLQFTGCMSKTKLDNSKDSESTEISVTIIDESSEPGEKEEALSQEADTADASVSSMVYSAVNCDLENKGFETQTCVAVASDESYSELGIGYYNPDFQLLEDDDYASMGFVTIANENENSPSLPDDCEYIAVEPIDGEFEECNAKYKILTYSCEDILPSHFVYDDQYVVYYQQDSTTVRYQTYANNRENYDLSLGSLYNYDTDSFIYDADLFDAYETHSGVELFSEEDYEKLEEELRQFSEQQEKNGYIVEEINIVYISPESIETYLASGEEDTFFGYNVSELESSIGKGTALVYTENGFESAQVYEESSEGYNWKSFLTKIGIGAGIILVGAILAPVTAGVSFSCALVTISKVAVTYALVESLGTLAVGTAKGLMDGKSFEDAIKGATFDGLDAFANGFMIGAVVGSVGVCSGIIKPSACFPAGTKVSVPADNGIEFVPIERLHSGDLVYSYNEDGQCITVNKIESTMTNRADRIIHLEVGNELISTTENHPFYSMTRSGWVRAAELTIGEDVLSINGDSITIEDITESILERPIEVYNFTVENDHTYFVSEEVILVHNKCDELFSTERNRAVKEAWKKEVDAVKNGTSKYNWTTDELNQLLSKGRVSGYDGCHIVDVSINPALAGNPENIIILPRYSSIPGEISHFLVHNNNWTNPSNWDPVVKVMPQFAEQIEKMLIMGGLIG